MSLYHSLHGISVVDLFALNKIGVVEDTLCLYPSLVFVNCEIAGVYVDWVVILMDVFKEQRGVTASG